MNKLDYWDQQPLRFLPQLLPQQDAYSLRYPVATEQEQEQVGLQLRRYSVPLYLTAHFFVEPQQLTARFWWNPSKNTPCSLLSPLRAQYSIQKTENQKSENQKIA